jgi:NIMA (never in mitosis gene a)-related kinase
MSLKNFEILSKLGSGAFSTVYKVKRLRDGEIYALKQVKLAALKPKERENALNEVRILASVSHPNIVKYREAFIDPNTNNLCIIMEYCEEGDLLLKIQKCQKTHTTISERSLWSICLQALHGLKALHDMKILHRDLKCANVFICRDGTVKLGDLNVSIVAKYGIANT